MSERAIILLFDRDGLLHYAFIGPHDQRYQWFMAEATEKTPSWEPATCDITSPFMRTRTFTHALYDSFATTHDTRERVYVSVYSENPDRRQRELLSVECWLESIVKHDFERHLPYNGPEQRRKAQESKEKRQREFAEEVRRIALLSELTRLEGEAL